MGGGFLVVPSLLVTTNMAIVEAIGTSLFSVGTFGLTTALNYSLSGMVNWFVVLALVCGGLIGGIFGAKVAKCLSKQRQALNNIFSAVVRIVAIYMIIKNVDALN
ncbi:sulfite exporter TauE/SafE family protein [Peribacillus frigoritolerans]|nr:sulfite exporter TauE/SafE family protein [Peribacillus frigoritolerans]MDG4850009.1 sulfite exporter TauE/SafE family protein [Peribacillus frigoritolerans]